MSETQKMISYDIIIIYSYLEISISLCVRQRETTSVVACRLTKKYSYVSRDLLECETASVAV